MLVMGQVDVAKRREAHHPYFLTGQLRSDNNFKFTKCYAVV